MVERLQARWGSAAAEAIYVGEREVTECWETREMRWELGCSYCRTRSGSRVTIEAREHEHFIYDRISREVIEFHPAGGFD